ncbi:hypothetical protein BD309DRAFT_867769 [Dichomitus squalens]|uniref:Uncharacterized protein n=1 Tax=Dichomitus squalens TaxID=114155 RepID=A0A4Q9NQS4_9APHY|nr:uncharacterized protein DICSQDRAFT_54317 [Dichomitus squalens LYAD-421 SS1]EJF63760.1 hypothetical protein DICSQDRAFT_54317 [Dichomitus squalens LYAD-421 SS1]TBU41716.1 hypothetical protein BD309DRAFT_867769 [Dichomitus squalens]TBU59340.1 hypothetical protein BD310DRAFT_817544 [Dichomitus squalens]
MRSGTSSESRTVSYQPTRREIHDRIPAIRAETSSANLRTYAQVSAAGKYLRHMASTPNIAKPPASSLRRAPSERISSLNVEHPLPSSWLESVTQAVLRTNDGAAHIGGPISRPSSRQSERPLRAFKENKFLLDDKTLRPSQTTGRSASGLPPSAILYLQPPRTAPSAVNTAHVTCRSAPGSRSTSRAGDRLQGNGSLRGRKDRHDRARRGSRPAPTDRVPSLASTRIENDAWAGMHWQDGRRVPLAQLEDASYEEAVDSDDDDEGELDLARLLVPPKRQYSIQSLRKHLHVAHAQTRAAYPRSEWEEEGVATRGRGRRVDIDESDGYPTFERTDSPKRRRGLPGAWGALGNGR